MQELKLRVRGIVLLLMVAWRMRRNLKDIVTLIRRVTFAPV
jgi:hypothetical protein